MTNRGAIAYYAVNCERVFVFVRVVSEGTDEVIKSTACRAVIVTDPPLCPRKKQCHLPRGTGNASLALPTQTKLERAGELETI